MSIYKAVIFNRDATLNRTTQILRAGQTAGDTTDGYVLASHELELFPAVRPALAAGATHLSLDNMSLDELRRFSEQIDADVFDVLTLEGSVNARDHIGGTAPNQVRAAVARGRQLLAQR